MRVKIMSSEKKGRDGSLITTQPRSWCNLVVILGSASLDVIQGGVLARRTAGRWPCPGPCLEEHDCVI